MRKGCLIAVLLGAAQALALGAVPLAQAQVSDAPPLTPPLSPPSLTPSLPAPTPAPPVQPAPPPPLAAPEASPSAPLAAPDASEPEAADQPPLAQETAPPVPADPVVALIRSKLADPNINKDANGDDLAALQAFYATRSGGPLWTTEMGFSAKGQAAIFEIEKADAWGLDAKAFDLPSAGDLPGSSEAQALGEIKLDLAILKYARFARGGRLVPSNVSELFDQAPPLRDPKIVLTEIEAADAPGAYLQSLHPKHEQFERLRQALLKARGKDEEGGKPAGNDKDIKRLIINMERWRWMQEDLGSIYVLNNSPAFMLFVVKDGKTIFADKTLVGTIGYATPVFTADMKSIVFNPDWNAPETVVKENILPPLQQRNYSILRIHKLYVSSGGTPIDATKVDWNRVNVLNYTFSQKAGPHNNLGKVKFLFPNRHTVYMHDTLPVRKKYFKQTARMIGHECVRMEKPDRFAEILLAEDKGWAPARVKELWDNGVNSSVSLDKKIPVHVVYFTAVVDESGKVETSADVYGLDRKLASALFGDTTGFPAPPPESKQPPAGEADASTPAGRRTTADNDFARAMQGFTGD
jgi:murein L,D-transpeptidase YcbB/YkuD